MSGNSSQFFTVYRVVTSKLYHFLGDIKAQRAKVISRSYTVMGQRGYAELS